MRREIADLPVAGKVVIGEGDRDEVSMLYVGEELGRGGPAVDIAVDPLEGTTLCAKSLPGALAVVAVAEKGGLLNAPGIYMEKIAIGPGYEEGLVSLDLSIAENLNRLAPGERRLGRRNHGLCARPSPPREANRRNPGGWRCDQSDRRRRHRRRDSNLRTGRNRHRHLPRHGRSAGGCPCRSGAALHRRPDPGPARGSERPSYEASGALRHKDLKRTYSTADMASGDIIFAATGVTDGALLSGVSSMTGNRDPHRHNALRNPHGAMDLRRAHGSVEVRARPSLDRPAFIGGD